MKHIEKIVIGMIAVLFVVIVIIATDFWLLWLPLEHSSEYPQKIAALFMALTAFVTLLVVYATFNATKQSNLREETRRKDEIRKENRDRDERLLNEIIEWAVEVVKIGLPRMASTSLIGKPDDEADRRRILDSLGVLDNNFRAMIAKSLYVSRIGLAFGEKLQSSITELESNLRKQDDLIRKCLEIIVKRQPEKFNNAWDELISNWNKLGDSAAGVIDEAVIEKLNILNI